MRAARWLSAFGILTADAAFVSRRLIWPEAGAKGVDLRLWQVSRTAFGGEGMRPLLALGAVLVRAHECTCLVRLNQLALAVVDHMLDELRRPAGKVFLARL